MPIMPVMPGMGTVCGIVSARWLGRDLVSAAIWDKTSPTGGTCRARLAGLGPWMADRGSPRRLGCVTQQRAYALNAARPAPWLMIQ